MGAGGSRLTAAADRPLQSTPPHGRGSWIVDDPRKPKPDGWTRFVCFSDTHGKSLPEGPSADVLIHAGDFTMVGEVSAIEELSKWLANYPATHKIVIAGNHDLTFDKEFFCSDANRFRNQIVTAAHKERARTDKLTPDLVACDEARAALQNCIYLEDCAGEVAGYTIWGSPWQPEIPCNPWAFNYARGNGNTRAFDKIPANLDVDVLVTHGPPRGFGDACFRGQGNPTESVGCDELLAKIRNRAIPVHVSGHIHEDAGTRWDHDGARTLMINASTCDLGYRPSQLPVVFELPPAAELRRDIAA